MTISDDDFRVALRSWASGVCVVTAAANGEMHGMAVSSFGSVSLQPKLISVCLAEKARTLTLALAAERFAVNVLSAQQNDVSHRFSVRDASINRFPEGSFELGPRHCPLLYGALAHLECVLFAAHTAGDHRVLIGEVLFARTYAGSPLLYHDRRYCSIAPQP